MQFFLISVKRVDLAFGDFVADEGELFVLELVLTGLPVDGWGGRLHVHDVVAQLRLPLVLPLTQAQ
jgi:hypothetical protein